MMKNQALAVSGVGLLVVLTFPVQPASAERCPSGKAPVTILNPAGKAIEICVTPAAIPHIGGGSDSVIPAICPCFSQEDVAGAIASDPTYTAETVPGVTAITDEACTFAEVWSPVSSVDFSASRGPADAKISGSCIYEGRRTVLGSNNYCAPWDFNSKESGITPEEAEACVALLRTFVQK